MAMFLPVAAEAAEGLAAGGAEAAAGAGAGAGGAETAAGRSGAGRLLSALQFGRHASDAAQAAQSATAPDTDVLGSGTDWERS